MRLSQPLSGYLDLLRFLAALSVLLGHMQQDGLYMSWMPLSRFSHEAVIIFFVMSGMIIYSTTANAGRTARDYFIARTSRIFSVALPAIIFSLAAMLLVSSIDRPGGSFPSNYVPFQWRDLLSSALFVNEVWMNPASLSMNNPYWSLCYEVWYYVLFGLYFFIKRKLVFLPLALLAILLGPAIMALFPIWVAGAWVAKKGEGMSAHLGPWTALLGFFGSMILVVAINLSGTDLDLQTYLRHHLPGLWRLRSSQRFLTDYLIGAAVILNILAFAHLPTWFQDPFAKFKPLLGHLAGFSFTIYLFHRPITQIWGFYYPNHSESILVALVSAALILALCYGISFLTERQLKHWRIGLDFATRSRAN